MQHLGVLKNSLKRVRVLQIELEFESVGFLRRGENQSAWTKTRIFSHQGEMLVTLATISVAISSPAKYCSVTIRKKPPIKAVLSHGTIYFSKNCSNF